MTEEYSQELVKSGLDRMTISIDGATQKTYEIYRKNGNIDLVFKNIKLLVQAKKKLNSVTPHLHWQFLVFKHNENEIELAREISKTIGVNDIGFTAPFCDISWASNIEQYNNYLVKEGADKEKKQVIFKNADRQLCNWLWDAITINADGSISPCCSVEDKKDDFEMFDKNKSFAEIWNSQNYVRARKFVLDREKKDFVNVCTKCNHIGASNHKDISVNKTSNSNDIAVIEKNLVEQNKDLNFLEYEQKKVILKSYPTSLFIQVDAPCNIECFFSSRPEIYQYFNLDDFKAKYEEKLWPAFQSRKNKYFRVRGTFIIVGNKKKFRLF